MSFGSSGSIVNASVSRADENQTGWIRLARMICPLGPGCEGRRHDVEILDRCGLIRGAPQQRDLAFGRSVDLDRAAVDATPGVGGAKPLGHARQSALRD